MLELSKLVDGQQAKELDRMCEQYNDASVIITDNSKLKTQAGDFIKSVCCELDTVYETSNYVVTMGHTGARESVDVKVVKEVAPELYDLLKAKGLIKKTDNSLKLNSVKSKGKRV